MADVQTLKRLLAGTFGLLTVACSSRGPAPDEVFYFDELDGGSFSIVRSGTLHQLLLPGLTFDLEDCSTDRQPLCFSGPAFIVSVPAPTDQTGDRWTVDGIDFEIERRDERSCDGRELAAEFTVIRSQEGRATGRYLYSIGCGLRIYSEVDATGTERVFMVSRQGLFAEP